MQMIIDAKQRFSVFFSCFFVEKSFFSAKLAIKMKKIISLWRKWIIIFVSSSFLSDPELGRPFSRPFCFAWSNMADRFGRRRDEIETVQITIEKTLTFKRRLLQRKRICRKKLDASEWYLMKGFWRQKNGSGSWIRTSDQVVNSHLLYRWAMPEQRISII